MSSINKSPHFPHRDKVGQLCDGNRVLYWSIYICVMCILYIYCISLWVKSSALTLGLLTETFERNFVLPVSVLPKSGPRLTGLEKEHQAGEMINTSCNIPPSLPPPNITWSVNGEKVKRAYFRDRTTLFFVSNWKDRNFTFSILFWIF